jgi:hypothetical protein
VSLYEGTRVWGKRHWREREPRGRGRYTRLGRRCRKCGNAIPRCEDETYPQETTDASESAKEQQGRGEPWSAAGGAGGRTETLVAEVVRRMSEQEPVRIPKEVLEELESVRRYTRAKYWTYRPCDTWRWRRRSPRWSCGSTSTSKSTAWAY